MLYSTNKGPSTLSMVLARLAPEKVDLSVATANHSAASLWSDFPPSPRKGVRVLLGGNAQPPEHDCCRRNLKHKKDKNQSELIS